MKQKFKIGDRVKFKAYDINGIVKNIKLENENGQFLYILVYNNGLGLVDFPTLLPALSNAIEFMKPDLKHINYKFLTDV